MNDANAWTTRTRGTRNAEWRERVDDAAAWHARSTEFQKSLAEFLGRILTEFSARNYRLELGNMQKRETQFILHNFLVLDLDLLLP